MTRRDLIPIALALVLVPATAAGVLWAMMPPSEATLAFPNPTHRLAIATEAAMEAELGTIRRGDSETAMLPILALPPSAVAAPPGGLPSIELRDTFFGVPPTAPSKAPRWMQLRLATFNGRARDGREVVVTIKPDPFGEGSVVDFHGDARLAAGLGPKIAEALAHPAHPRGSDEDLADLADLIGPGAKVTAIKTITIPAPASVAPPSPPVNKPAIGPTPAAPGGVDGSSEGSR